MGGGMRQAGILAAAGIIALEEQTSLLKKDHIFAKKIANELAKIPGIVINPRKTEINLIFFSWSRAKNVTEANRIQKVFENHKIIINSPDNGTYRFATHFWIGENEVERILTASLEAFC